MLEQLLMKAAAGDLPTGGEAARRLQDTRRWPSERDALLRVGWALDGTPEQRLSIANDWLRVRGRDGRLRPLRANAAQRAFEAWRGRQNIVLKARQMGITTWVAGRFFLRTVTQPGTLTVLVAHTQKAAEAIFATVERMWVHLPADLREGVLRRSRANAGSMVFARLDSEFRVGSAADENAGRGLSIQNLHCSEVSRWPGDAAATLAGLRAALAPGGELVLESTPNGAYGAFYEEWCGAGDGSRIGEQDSGDRPDAAGLVRHFFPWWMEPAYAAEAAERASLRDEERKLVEQQGLTLRQIGYRRELERTYGVLRRQEFAEDAETCFRATGACCFDAGRIEQRMAELEPARETRRSGALEIYFPPADGRVYCVAVDTAGGGEDGDFAAVQVVELRSGLQCAELQERLRPADLARVAAALAREYGEAVLAVERNNHGAAVLAYLETSERYARVYRGDDGQAGWLTTAVSKAGTVTRMERLLRDAPELFRSRRLLGECRSFVSGENGRMAAARGSHDDLVMAMAVAQAVRAEREAS